MKLHTQKYCMAFQDFIIALNIEAHTSYSYAATDAHFIYNSQRKFSVNPGANFHIIQPHSKAMHIHENIDLRQKKFCQVSCIQVLSCSSFNEVCTLNGTPYLNGNFIGNCLSSVPQDPDSLALRTTTLSKSRNRGLKWKSISSPAMKSHVILNKICHSYCIYN